MTELRWNDGYAGLNVDASCKRIGLLIRQSGLSDKELAGMLGLSVQSVNKWRHGHHLPDVENLFLLGRILGRQVDNFPYDHASHRIISCTCGLDRGYFAGPFTPDGGEKPLYGE